MKVPFAKGLILWQSNSKKAAILSVVDIKIEGKIKTYPNPVKKEILIIFQLDSNFNSEKIEPQIINYLGQVVVKNTFYPNRDSNIVSIETQNL